MGLDLNALKKLQEEMTSGSSNQNKLAFLNARKITGETDIRVLPPLPEANGVFFQKKVTWWITNNGKKLPYVSPNTFGGVDVVQEEVTKAKKLAEETKDKELMAIVSDWKTLSKEISYLVPILHFEFPNFNGEGFPVNTNGSPLTKEDIKKYLVGGTAKVLECGQFMLTDINKISTNRAYANGTPDGFTDRLKGYNIILNKVGEGKNVKYSADALRFSMEMPEEFYKPDAIPSVWKMVQAQVQEDEYLRGLIRNYLYGEPMPTKPEKGDKVQDEVESSPKVEVNGPKVTPQPKVEEKVEEAPTRARRTTQVETPEELYSEEPVKDEPEEEAPRRRSRNLSDDIMNIS